MFKIDMIQIQNRHEEDQKLTWLSTWTWVKHWTLSHATFPWATTRPRAVTHANAAVEAVTGGGEVAGREAPKGSGELVVGLGSDGSGPRRLGRAFQRGPTHVRSRRWCCKASAGCIPWPRRRGRGDEGVAWGRGRHGLPCTPVQWPAHQCCSFSVVLALVRQNGLTMLMNYAANWHGRRPWLAMPRCVECHVAAIDVCAQA